VGRLRASHIKRIRREWRVSTLRDFDSACELELQQLDRVEREAWELFARSQTHRGSPRNSKGSFAIAAPLIPCAGQARRS
jgi:hypothetical protein